MKNEGKSLCRIGLDLIKQGNIFRLVQVKITTNNLYVTKLVKTFINTGSVHNAVRHQRDISNELRLFKILKELKFHSYKNKLV